MISFNYKTILRNSNYIQLVTMSKHNLVPRASYLFDIEIAVTRYQKGKMPWERGWSKHTQFENIYKR